MKNYTITVNGNVYHVTVEEGTTAGVIQNTAPAAAAPAAAPAAASAAPAAGSIGAVDIKVSVPGKVVKIDAKPGKSVKAGDSVVVVESMKMEIPVVAPQDGVIASIDVAPGDSVEAGDILATMN